MSNNNIIINFQTNIGNFPQAMQQVQQGITKGVAAVKNSHGPFAMLQKDFSATANYSKTASGAIQTFGNQAQQSQSKLQRFGEAFKGNRGIVFGIAGLTSALAEAVGMMGMYGDSAQRLGEAQQKLNTLMDQGVTSGKAYQDAQNEVTKQQRFFNMVQRNTILSQMDMVFFTTMAVSGLIKLGTSGIKTNGIFSKLTSIFKVHNATLVQGSGALTHYASVTNTASANTGILGKSIGALGISIKGALVGTGIGAAIVGIGLLIQKLMEWQEAQKKAAEEQKRATETIKLNQEVWQRISTQTGESFLKDWEGMSEAATEHAQIIVDAIKYVAREQEISDKRAALLQAYRMQQQEFVTRLEIEASLRRVEAVKAEQLAKDQIAGRPHLKKLYEQESAAEKDLNKQRQESIDRANIYGETIETLSMQLAGLETNTIDMTNVQQMLTDNIMVAKSEAATTATTFETMFNNFANGKNLMATADEVMQGVNLTLQRLVQDSKLSADQAEVMSAKWEALLGIADGAEEGFTRVTEELEIMGGVMQGISEQDALTSFILQFNTNVAQSSNVLQDAGDKLELVKQKYAGKIAAAEAAGVATQVLTKLLEEEDASYIEIILALAQYKSEQDAAKDAKKDAAKAQKEVNKEVEKEKEALMDSITALSERGIRATMNTKINELLAESYDEQVASILHESDVLTANNIIWQQLNDTQMMEIVTMQKNINAESMRVKILEQSKEGNIARNAAVIEGTQAFQEEITEIEKNNIALQQQRALWVELIQKTMPYIDTTVLLTSELAELGEAFDTTSDSAIKTARIFDEQFEEAKNTFDSVFNADSVKDFNKAFKDLDLGAIPKKLKDDVKRMMEEIKHMTEAGKEASTAFDIVVLALSKVGKETDELSKKEIHKIMDKALDKFEEWAALDPESCQLFESFPQLFDDLEDKTGMFSLTVAMLAEAMRNGGFDALGASKFLAMYVAEGGKLSEISDENKEKLSALGIQFDENNDGIDDFSGKVIDATEGIEDFNAEMAKVEATAIVAETVKAMWTDMSTVMIKQTALVGEAWATSMLLMNIDAASASLDVQTYFDTDIPAAMDVSIEKARELAAGLLSIATLMQGGAGAKGADQFNLQNIFNPNGGGPGDIPTGPPAASGPSDPFNKRQLNQLRISDEKGGKGGLAGQWQTMLDQMLTALQTTIESMNGEFAKLVQYWADAITVMIESNQVLHENWAENTLFIAEETSILVVEIAKTWGTLITEMDDMNQALEQAWSDNCANMAQNARDAGKGIQDEFNQAIENVAGKMNQLAKHWSKVCNSMIANAKSAAKGIQKAMDSIKDTESVHTIRTVRVGQSKGGVWSMEDGGISAAGGMTVSNGPTDFGPFTYGDNSGGREIHAFIPLDGNKAQAIMDQLDTITGRRREVNLFQSGGKDKDIIVPITVNINGEQYSFTQRYRIKQGHDIANQVF